MTEYEYNGPGNRHYPGHPHPETGAVLHGTHPEDPETGYPLWEEPGEPIDFGDQLPPADGHWYDIDSSLPYLGPPEPAGVGAAQEAEVTGTEKITESGTSEPEPSGTGAEQDQEV